MEKEAFRKVLKNYLKGLKDNLSIIEEQRNRIRALVQLFQTASVYGGDAIEELIAEAAARRMTGALAYLMTLKGIMNGITRHAYNQTPPDKPVTADTVILGGDFKIDEAPASYWMANETEARETKLSEGGFNAWHVVHDHQAGKAVEGWLQKLSKNIRNLEHIMNP